MLDLVVRHLGEGRIGPLWDELMAPMYETYDVYDTATHPWPALDAPTDSDRGPSHCAAI